MTIIKEKIIGAISAMSDNDAEKVWNLIQATFNLSYSEEVDPDWDEFLICEAYRNGDDEYKPQISHEELLKELNLK